MKLKLICSTILYLLLFNTVFGQYIPFVEEGKFWIYQNHQDQDFPSAISGHAITFSGDTLINSLTYKKVYRHILKGDFFCPDFSCWVFDTPYQTDYKILNSFIREDTMNKKVYHLPKSNSGYCDIEEYILFDFSLNLGDTLNYCAYESIWADDVNFNSLIGGIVDSIKLVETQGELRKTIFTFGFYNILGMPAETEVRLSEGVGFLDSGIFRKQKSLFVDYCEGEVEQCNLILSNKSTQPQIFDIFPNPSNGIFTISMKDNNVESVNIYTILGQLKKEFGPINQIDLSGFKSGIYIVEVNMRDNKKIIRKISIKG